MFRCLRRRLSLAFLAALLVIGSVLVGCGGGESSAGVEVLIGLETDLTGPACTSIAPVYNGLEDYLEKANEEGVVPGATVKIVTYDHRTDYSRIPVGYQWLKGKGVNAIMFPSPTDIQMLISRLTEDKIPAFGTTALTSWMDEEWAFGTSPTMQISSERCAQWIMDEWDYEGTDRSPEVGFVGIIGSVPTEAHQEGFEDFIDAHPDKFNYVGAKLVPASTSTFAHEISVIEDCDWVFVYFYQTTLTGFVREARARGYVGNIMSTSASMPGYWNLVRANVPAEELYGCYHVHYMPWVEDNSFATEWQSYINENRSADFVAVEGQSPSYATGIYWGKWVVDVVKRAVEEVGAENVDGQAIRDAAESTNMEQISKGWANDWVQSPTNHILITEDKMYNWNVDTLEWDNLSDAIVLRD